MLSRLGNNGGHLLDLSQGSLVSTQSLLCQLLGSLLTSVSDQLDQSTLVRGEASNLLDNVAHKRRSLRKSTLSVRDLGSGLLGVSLATLVQSNSDSGSSHLCM